MDDKGVLSEISRLVDEEHRLLSHPGLDSVQRRELEAIQVHLDQCWDLLRQRRGLRHAGEDPGDAHVRDAATVERYQQ